MMARQELINTILIGRNTNTAVRHHGQAVRQALCHLYRFQAATPRQPSGGILHLQWLSLQLMNLSLTLLMNPSMYIVAVQSLPHTT